MNDVIMTSLPKQWQNLDLLETKQNIYIIQKVLMRAIQDEVFVEFEPLCQKLWIFLSNFGSFYDTHSPNMVMSRDPRYKFQKFLFCPNSTFNI